MITIAELIEKIIMDTPFLEEGLSEGIINLSALARQIKPEIEATLMKPVTESALIMALKRMTPAIAERVKQNKKSICLLGDITVRSDLSEFTFRRSETLLEKQKKLLHEADTLANPFITFTQGVFEITAIVNATLEKVVEDIFKGETIISRLKNLASITIRLSAQTVHMPGVHYSVLKQLAWKNINVVEVVSTLTEFTIVLEKKDIDVSFSLLMKFLANKKGKTNR